jgi:Ser/Thr protein kinase RdoA (MazF antagonist)
MSESTETPYALLTPDRVLDAVASIGFIGDGRLLALNSYENRVYQIWLEESRTGVPAAKAVVAKFYRPARWTDAQIKEEHAFVADLAEHEIPVVAAMPSENGETLHEFEGFRFAVYPRCGGRAPELDDRATLEWMGRFIGRMHAVGATARYGKRPAIDVTTFGEEPRDWLLAHHFVPDDLLDAWSSVVEQALEGVRRCFERCGDTATLRLHGDCHAGNVLWADAGPSFVDFDDSRMGPAIQDLWMLLSGDARDMAQQCRAVLSGYEDFCDFDHRQVHLIEPLRTLRLIHYSAWIARRWDDPAFPAAFPWFNTQRYWQDRILELREQIAAMQEAPIVI